MNNTIQNTVFYILIIDGLDENHVKLKNTINKLIPQSYIESIYSENESTSYFKNLKAAPSFIILDAQTQSTSLRLTIYMIRQNERLKRAPIVLINCELSLNQKRELKFLGINEFYSDLNNPIELRILANDIKSRWLLAKTE